AFVVVLEVGLVPPVEPGRSLAHREARVNPTCDGDAVFVVCRGPLLRPVHHAGHLGLPDLLVPDAAGDISWPRIAHLGLVLVHAHDVEGTPGVWVGRQMVNVIVTPRGQFVSLIDALWITIGSLGIVEHVPETVTV